MQHHTLRVRHLAASLGLAFAGSAGAETSPYYIGASETLSYQSNIYSSSENPIGSGISTTSLLGGFDQPIGRQRVFATGTVGYNYYTNEVVKLLNNTSYGVNAGLDWQTIERLSGTVRLSANQSLANYALAETPSITQRNIQNLSQATLTGRYGVTPRVGLDAGYQYRKLEFSAPEYADNEFSQNGVSLALRYGQTGVLNVGLGLRYTKIDYPRYQVVPGSNPQTFIADEATGKYVDFTVTWVPSGLSSLDARLSLSDINHTENKGSDFNGLTGALGWNYEATGKLSTRLSLVVAPGSGSTFYAFDGGPATVENSSLNKTLRFSAYYAATGKVTLNGNIGLSHNQYGQVTQTGTQYGTDLTSSVSLGATYAATRTITLICNVAYRIRNASQEAIATGQSYDYDGSGVNCTGQMMLQ